MDDIACTVGNVETIFKINFTLLILFNLTITSYRYKPLDGSIKQLAIFAAGKNSEEMQSKLFAVSVKQE